MVRLGTPAAAARASIDSSPGSSPFVTTRLILAAKTVTVNSVMITDLERDSELLAVIRRATSCDGLEFVAPPALLTGGFWAELVRFRLNTPPPGWDGDLV